MLTNHAVHMQGISVLTLRSCWTVTLTSTSTSTTYESKDESNSSTSPDISELSFIKATLAAFHYSNLYISEHRFFFLILMNECVCLHTNFNKILLEKNTEIDDKKCNIKTGELWGKNCGIWKYLIWLEKLYYISSFFFIKSLMDDSTSYDNKKQHIHLVFKAPYQFKSFYSKLRHLFVNNKNKPV